MNKDIGEGVPATLKPWPAAIIIDERIGRVRAYQVAPELGAIRLGRSLYIPTYEVSRRIGRDVTPADIKRANGIIREREDRELLAKAGKIKGSRRGINK
jgi:hypothetical protein